MQAQKNIIKNNNNNQNILNEDQLHKKIQLNRKQSTDTIFTTTDKESFTSEFIQKRQPKNQSCFNNFNQKYANNNKGIFIKEITSNSLFLFQCELEHKFYLTKKQIQSDIWCTTCTKTFQNIHKHAEVNQYQILNQKLEKIILMKCSNNHIIQSSYKKIFSKKCKECSKNNKNMLKEMLRRDNQQYEDQQKQKQNILLEEARRIFIMNQMQGQGQTQGQDQINQDQLMLVIQELQQLSEKYAENYYFKKESSCISSKHLGLHTTHSLCSILHDSQSFSYKKWSDKGGWLGSQETKEESSEPEHFFKKDEKITNFTDYQDSVYCCCRCYLQELRQSERFRQMKELYFMLIIPNNILQNFFKQFSIEELKKVFREKAFLVHPDKNVHPNAKVAFQKLFKHFDQEIMAKKAYN